ncbi:DUF3284 domain-containing protein [Candidatus Saccharibacteria bacterium]|nr:DUF3284 domain-containing protein [Candidatus Saccharibacteria bacterium]
MKSNRLTIRINKPVHEVFTFSITPPNSTHWITGIVKEETSEWPIKVGTTYKLQDKSSEWFEVIVTAIKQDDVVEWISKDKNYHCRYTLRSINDNTTELEYHEWVDTGNLEEPFTQDILEKLKQVLEK